MAANFSPCKGSYVLNQFPRNVMFGMNGFHVSASGAIQGHHGPLVPFPTVFSTGICFENFLPFSTNLKLLSLQTLSVWKSPKFVVLERVKSVSVMKILVLI